MDRVFGDVTMNLKTVRGEHRTTKPWRSEYGERSLPYTWVLFSTFPELSRDGKFKYAIGVMTDISDQKWIQGESARRAAEAVEEKRQQVCLRLSPQV